MNVGIHTIPAEQYHADPCPAPSFSASIGKVIIGRSPLHAYLEHPRLGGTKSEPTAAMEFGSLVHALALGKSSDVEVLQFDDYKTKAAREARDAVRMAGRIPTLPKHNEHAENIACAVVEELSRYPFADSWARAEPERVLIASQANQYGPNPVWMRAMLDKLDRESPDGIAHIYDLKTCANASPEFLPRTIASLNYDLQAAHYEFMVEMLFPQFKGRVDFTFVFVESEPPFSVVPVRLDESFRAVGRSKLGRAYDAWCKCIASGVWPSYVDSVLTVGPPPWLIEDELETEIQPTFS